MSSYLIGSHDRNHPYQQALRMAYGNHPPQPKKENKARDKRETPKN